MVELSPPGTTSPSQASSSAAVRTSTARAPARSRALRCASKSPCKASTPAVFIALAWETAPSLPASGLQQFRFGELRNIQTAHGLAQFLARLQQLGRVVKISGGLDDGARAAL